MKYIGVKIVEASEMTASIATEKGYKVPDDTDQMAIGFEVTYPGGYKSWCPYDAFTEANRSVAGMSFGFALEAARKGEKIARSGWNWKNQFVVMQPTLNLPPFSTTGTNRKVNDRTAKFIGENEPLNCPAYCCLYNAQKEWVCGWVPSQGDLFADDWLIIDDAATTALQQYEMRVIEEHEELEERLKRLDEFLSNGSVTAKISLEKLKKLQRQYYHMTNYLEVLSERIELFEKFD